MATYREVRIYEHLSKTESRHPGQGIIRELYDTFELRSPAGEHQCLVQPPMHMSVMEMMIRRGEPLSLPLLKLTSGAYCVLLISCIQRRQ